MSRKADTNVDANAAEEADDFCSESWLSSELFGWLGLHSDPDAAMQDGTMEATTGGKRI